jgi:hypothetical protein
MQWGFAAAELAQTAELKTLITSYGVAGAVDDCDAFMIEFALLPSLNVAVQTSKLRALRAAGTDFTEVARLGEALQLSDGAPGAVSHCLPPSEVCQQWAARYTALVRRVEDKCRQLALAEDSEALMTLATKLEELRALDVAALVPVAAEATDPAVLSLAGEDSASKLVHECKVLVWEYQRVLSLSDAIEQKEKLQREYAALVGTTTDFTLLGRLGNSLGGANTASERLHWRGCEVDCLTLPGRLSSLVQSVTARCRQLAYSGDYDTLATLAAKLDELKALERAAPPRAWFVGPLRPPGVAHCTPTAHTADAIAAVAVAGVEAAPMPSEEGDEDCANDPVYVPPTPGPVADIEEDCANDPVYVAPALISDKRPADIESC